MEQRDRQRYAGSYSYPGVKAFEICRAVSAFIACVVLVNAGLDV